MFPNQCTVIIPDGLNFFMDKELYDISVGQNRHSGEHEAAKFSGQDSRGSRRILMGVSEEFATGLRSLEGIVGIAGYSVKCNLKNTQNKWKKNTKRGSQC